MAGAKQALEGATCSPRLAETRFNALQRSVERVENCPRPDRSGPYRITAHAIELVKLRRNQGESADLATTLVASPLWQLDIVELTGHNIEARGREEVNELLGQGWRLLHIYTLKYQEDGVWRERPMAILGRPRKADESRNFQRDE